MTPVTGKGPGYTYVGFGLGAIQTGLFLYEAMASNAFNRLVVAEVIPEIVSQVRENRGFVDLNIAHAGGIEKAHIGPLELYDPANAADHQRLVDALAGAHEIGTAVPGVKFYTSPGAESLSRILAQGLHVKVEKNGPRVVIYTAENHNRAAEILKEQVLAHLDYPIYAVVAQKVRFLNTVIGKMSGVITGKNEINSLELIPMFPGSQRAFVVEDFNRILISKVTFTDDDREPPFQRGITSFIEKDNLLPFEEAKLFGHNATHSMAAYLGTLLGLQRIAEIPSIPGLMEFLRIAFIGESGKALVHRYAGLDTLFTPEGYANYAADLLRRMTNPWLSDTVERVGRDVERKLAWDDRLVGTLRLCMAEGLVPHRYALGTAAALVSLYPRLLNVTEYAEPFLRRLWGSTSRDPGEESQVLALIDTGLTRLRRWHASGWGDITLHLNDLLS